MTSYNQAVSASIISGISDFISAGIISLINSLLLEDSDAFTLENGQFLVLE